MPTCFISVLLECVTVGDFFYSFLPTTQLESVARAININCTDWETLFFKQRTVSSEGWDEFPMLMLQSCESANLGSFPGQASWEALSAKKNIVSSIILWSGQQSCFQERDSLYFIIEKGVFCDNYWICCFWGFFCSSIWYILWILW
jgi:hypothetical protein